MKLPSWKEGSGGGSGGWGGRAGWFGVRGCKALFRSDSAPVPFITLGLSLQQNIFTLRLRVRNGGPYLLVGVEERKTVAEGGLIVGCRLLQIGESEILQM